MEPVSTKLGALSTLMEEIDDWCGTRPHRPFPPKPHGIRDALIAVAIHNLAGQIADAKTREQIQTLAGGLYTAGGKGIAG
jgi:hypothetical protein